jgi:hypothetical protein
MGLTVPRLTEIPHEPGCMSQTSDRRQSERIPGDFRAELYLIFPEVTFQPVPFLVQVMDASREGLRLRVPRFTEKQFERIQDKIEYGLFVLRNEQHVVRLYCFIVWKERITVEDGSTSYELGLRYDLRAPDSDNDIDFILERARGSEISAKT